MSRIDQLSVNPFSRFGDNWSAAIDPLDFDADYYAALDWYDVPEAYRIDTLDCAHHAVLDGTDASDLKPYHKRTEDLDNFKSWIGLPDSYIRSGKAVAQPCDRPRVYDQRLDDPGANLSEAEQRDVFLAAGCYLFGDSAAVAKYRRAIELRLAPFDIAVYAARRVILRPSGSLTISGPPAVLIAGQVDIHPGAALVTHTVSRILSDHLVKIEA
jgi:hypothetical protein